MPSQHHVLPLVSAEGNVSFWKRQRLSLLLAVTYFYFFQGADPNQHSRILLTQSIVERHAITLGPMHGLTIDKSEYAGEFFCDKAPGISFLATPLWALFNGLDRIFNASIHNFALDRTRLHLLTFVLCGLAGVWTASGVRRVAFQLGASAARAEVLGLIYGLGTLAFPFSTALFGHQLSAALVMALFGLLVKADSELRLSRAELLQFGFFSSLTILTEYPSALIVACFGVTYLRIFWRQTPSVSALIRSLAPVAAAGIPMLVAHSVYLTKAFGRPWSLPYGHVFEPFFRQHHDQGLLGVQLPTPEGIIGVFLTPYRGLFFFCPVLLIGIFGLGCWLKQSNGSMLAGTVATTLLAYTIFTTSYYAWDGGGSIGPRHIIPVLGLVSVSAMYARGHLLNRIHAFLALISIAMMLLSTAVLLHLGGDDVLFSNPFYSTVLPSFLRGELSLNTQAVFGFYPRADASYNLGTLVGLTPLISILLLVLLWLLVYPPRLFWAMLVHEPTASPPGHNEASV